jgi:hypothetical protein
VKRWAGLLLVLVAAAIVALVIAARMRPDDLERRHATIRVGMTLTEVKRIMNPGREPDAVRADGNGFTWEYRPTKRFLTRDVRLGVHFDADADVIRTTVDGVQVQP